MHLGCGLEFEFRFLAARELGQPGVQVVVQALFGPCIMERIEAFRARSSQR